MSWIKAAKLPSPSSAAMEELIKQLMEANLQQRQTNAQLQQTNAQQQTAHQEALLAQQQTNAQQQEQINLLREALLRGPDSRGAAAVPPDVRKRVRSALQKMTADDDQEAYLATFERVAGQEGLPASQWAEVLAPFLSGEAQKAYYDLSELDARDYVKVKAEILARLGVTVYMRAQRVHQWTYNRSLPARSQMHDLIHLVKKWLPPEDLTPAQMIERVVVDKFVRALPATVQRWVGQGDPNDATQLVCLVERYEATEALLRNTAPEKPPSRPSPRKTSPVPREGRPKVLDNTPARRLDVLRCWRCQELGHIAANCPLTSEPMDCGQARRLSCFARLACAADLTDPLDRSHLCQVAVAGCPTVALLDSGSLVTLVHESFIRPGALTGRRFGVLCIHGDLKEYPTALVTIKTPKGECRHEVGVVPTLPYGLILGRDFPLFSSLWPARRGEDNKVILRDPVVPLSQVPEPEPCSLSPQSPAVGVTAPLGESEGETLPLEVLAGDAEELGPIPAWPDLEVSRDNFGTAQLQDPTLVRARENVAVVNGVPQSPGADQVFPHLAINNELLYHVNKVRGEILEQLVVPQAYRRTVLDLAHKHVLGGHLGAKKTEDRIQRRFFWPGLVGEVQRYCRSCPECQVTAPMAHFRSPLVPLPIVEVPFERIAMDLVGPLVKSARGHQHILVIMDYATRYPEAVPLRHTSAKLIAKELFALFCRVGIPKEILTDQGTPFMSKVTKELCKLFRITHLRTSVYHPQTDGLVERFNQTLKSMLRRVVQKDGKDWDFLLPYLMFAIREVPQSSTGFSPFELVYGRHPRGLLDIAKEVWEQEPTPHKSVIEHISDMQDRIAAVLPIVKEHLEKAQEAQSRAYNRSARVRTFNPGDRVLVLVPTAESKFLAKWQGPYEVRAKVGDVNYKVYQPGRRKPEQIYHVNLLKAWEDRESLLSEKPPSGLTSGPLQTAPVLQGAVVAEVQIAETLSKVQQQEAKEFVSRNIDVFSEIPGRTSLIEHDIVTEPQVRVRMKPYRVPEARRQAVSEEVKKMLQLGVIEESKSDWASPIVLIPKPDGSWRFCNDFRKLNEVSKFDNYPMPRVDELIERLGKARYFTILDLTKGYWQVPLTDSAKEKTAFITAEGLFHYLTLPFGLHGAPATFQRLMDIVLKSHRRYASAYLDDIVIFSTDWASHLAKVQAVVDSLREAGLTANPKKCSIGLEEARYLGYVIGRGVIKPQVNKVEAIQGWPQPKTTKQVRAFLGIVGYYRRFIPNFASLSAPLTDLLKGKKSTSIRWSPEAEMAFQSLKVALCGQPLLVAPNFKEEFVVQTDASEVGLGAVLSQEVNGEEHPVIYLSRKLLPAEKNYSVVEKECLAIKWALESLRYYLLGRHFRLVTDHAPLTWMRQSKERNARVTRWFLSLQNFSFTVEHRAGRLQGNADALSRAHCGLAVHVHPHGFEQRERVCEVIKGVVCEGRYISPRMCTYCF